MTSGSTSTQSTADACESGTATSNANGTPASSKRAANQHALDRARTARAAIGRVLSGDTLRRPSASKPARPTIVRQQSSIESAKKKVRRLSLQAERVESLERMNRRAIRQSCTGGGARGSFADVEQSTTALTRGRSSSGAEPMMNCKDDVPMWIAWAKEQAEMHAHFVHPRLQVPRSAHANPCPAADLPSSCGISPSCMPGHLAPPLHPRSSSSLAYRCCKTRPS